MRDLFPGAVASAVAASFLFFLAYQIASTPLWIVIVAAVAAMVYDLALAVRTGEGGS